MRLGTLVSSRTVRRVIKVMAMLLGQLLSLLSLYGVVGVNVVVAWLVSHGSWSFGQMTGAFHYRSQLHLPRILSTTCSGLGFTCFVSFLSLLCYWRISQCWWSESQSSIAVVIQSLQLIHRGFFASFTPYFGGFCQIFL